MLCEVYVCGAIRGGALSYKLDCKHYWCLSHYCIIKKDALLPYRKNSFTI